MRPWNRYTDRLHAIMSGANRQAVKVNALTITPEHVLAEIAREANGVGINLLRYSGISIEDANKPCDLPVHSDDGAVSSQWKRPMDPFLDSAIKLAVEEAIRLGDNYVGTEHVVLALAVRPDGHLRDEMARIGLN